MGTSTPPRGRLIDHIMLVVRDLAASRNFYEAVLGSLGIPLGGESEDCFWAEELFVCREDSAAARGHPSGPHHLALRARQREQVDDTHAIALVHGGRDIRGPGEHPCHAEHYAGFVFDPDGNHIEIVCHGPGLSRLLSRGIGARNMHAIHSMPT